MKKFTKITYMTLASFTLLTGCKGKELTNEEAKEVIKPIVEAQRSAYDEETAWTITSVVNGTVAGEKEKEEYKLSYNGEESAIYVYSNNNGEVEEGYYGLKDDVYYEIDVTNKEYSTTTIGASVKWDVLTEVLFVTAPDTLGTTISNLIYQAASYNLEGSKYYSSGEGNFVFVYESEKDGTSTYTFKNNLYRGTKTVVENEDNNYTSQLDVKYSSNVKLPSVSNYTQK